MITCFQFSRFSLQNYYLSDLTIGWNVKFCPRSISSFLQIWAINTKALKHVIWRFHIHSWRVTYCIAWTVSNFVTCLVFILWEGRTIINIHVHVSVLECLRFSSDYWQSNENDGKYIYIEETEYFEPWRWMLKPWIQCDSHGRVFRLFKVSVNYKSANKINYKSEEWSSQ